MLSVNRLSQAQRIQILQGGKVPHYKEITAEEAAKRVHAPPRTAYGTAALCCRCALQCQNSGIFISVAYVCGLQVPSCECVGVGVCALQVQRAWVGGVVAVSNHQGGRQYR